MKLYKAIIEVKLKEHNFNIEIPCCSSKKSALDMVQNSENCPLHCLKVIYFEELTFND